MEEAFEQFWRAYPTRPGNPKAPAKKVWDGLAKKKELPPIDQLLKAVAAYYAHCVKIGSLKTEYVAHARTWLNQKRWEAWMPEVREAITQPNPAVLPSGYEDAARALIEKIGANRWTMFFGKAQWSNGGDIIKIKVATGFERNVIEANYVADLERLTGKQIEVLV